MAPFLWHVFHFHMDRPNRRSGNCICDGIVSADCVPYPLHFTNQKETVNIHSRKDGVSEELVRVRAKRRYTISHSSIELFKLYLAAVAELIFPYDPHLTLSYGLLATYKHPCRMGKHCVTLGVTLNYCSTV